MAFSLGSFKLKDDETVPYGFAICVFVYTCVLVILLMMAALVLKLIGYLDCEGGEGGSTESSRLLPKAAIPILYGACGEEDEESGNCSRSNSSGEGGEEFYGGKICAICYDHNRCCFFVPCGHFASCYECSKRISEGEAKTCPFCRTDIHMIRRLFSL
ncbi:unnamed protein product [Cuscuta europaea]|uniref:RING-type domain-containing protein n=1 Tax=Cuscuta europaea TaxID=41803 RepID=A0A9P0Z254_CUSEU|nr:unnamed protein product [Cuscuta europaea]